jgi:hypothetical protein
VTSAMASFLGILLFQLINLARILALEVDISYSINYLLIKLVFKAYPRYRLVGT